jgi:hypothetical protein
MIQVVQSTIRPLFLPKRTYLVSIIRREPKGGHTGGHNLSSFISTSKPQSCLNKALFKALTAATSFQSILLNPSTVVTLRVSSGDIGTYYWANEESFDAKAAKSGFFVAYGFFGCIAAPLQYSIYI